MEIKKILKNKLNLNNEIEIFGWIRFKRISKNIIFLTIYDGSNIKGIQVVFKKDLIPDSLFSNVSSFELFTPIIVSGNLAFNSRTNENELVATGVKKLNDVDPYISLGKKEHGMEFLRENSHLRIRTTLFQAVMKIRSFLFQELHEFFRYEDFNYVSAPIITSNDAEGAGETFKLITKENQKFFSNTHGTLSVSGQLHAEAYAQGLGKVYTFAPTFRAENSNTTKHASEFWMLEPEMANYDYFKAMSLAEKMLKFVIKRLLSEKTEEIMVLEDILKIKLRNKLENILNPKFERISYEHAINILKKALDSKDASFENSKIEFGMDFGTEHERYLAEDYYGKPVFVYDFPFIIKSFYMYRNNDQKNTVRGFDLLVPGIGELIGGSQREDRYDELIKSLEIKNIDSEGLKWYLDLRKSGYAPSSGFGLGFERLLIYVTGIENIRDVIPFPRTPGKLIF